MAEWKYIACPYILNFNGIFYWDDVPAVVTPWMTHGTIAEYLDKHADADGLQLVRLSVPPSVWCRSLRILSPCSFWVWLKVSGISTRMG